MHGHICSTLIIKNNYTQCIKEMYKNNLNIRVKFVRNLALKSTIDVIRFNHCLAFVHLIEWKELKFGHLYDNFYFKYFLTLS